MKKFVAMALFALVGLSTVQTASAWFGGWGFGRGYGNCCGYNYGCCNSSYYTYDNCGCNTCGTGSYYY